MSLGVSNQFIFHGQNGKTKNRGFGFVKICHEQVNKAENPFLDQRSYFQGTSTYLIFLQPTAVTFSKKEDEMLL